MSSAITTDAQSRDGHVQPCTPSSSLSSSSAIHYGSLVQTFEFLPQWTPCRLPHPFLCALMLPGAAPEQQRGACHCLGQKLVLHVSMKPVMENTSLCRQRVSEPLSGAVLRDCRLILHPDQMLLQTASAQALVM